MNEYETLANNFKGMTKSNKGLGIIIWARSVGGQRGQPSVRKIRAAHDHGQYVAARFRGFVAKNLLKKLNVGSLMSSDLLEPTICPIGEACVHEILLLEPGETLGIECIFDVLQGEREIQYIDVYGEFTVKGPRRICCGVHAPLGVASRGRGWASASAAMRARERMQALGCIVGEKEGTKGMERFEGQER